MHPGEPLRADRITEAERVLYVTDAYRQVLISQQPAGDGPNGTKLYDVIIDVEEKRPRVMEYGGGYSTDLGPLGIFELTNVNFMNRLRQAAMRIRVSQRQQLVRFEVLDPRFIQIWQAPIRAAGRFSSIPARFFDHSILSLDHRSGNGWHCSASG